MAEGSIAQKCGFMVINGTPAFVMVNVTPVQAKRVYGATFSKIHGAWLFPAFYPYGINAYRDLEIVIPDIVFNPVATKHISTLLARDADSDAYLRDLALRKDFLYHTKPYRHQEEAVRFVLGNLRCGLFYDMGLGKTKVMIDVIRHERKKTLVLAPSVGVQTWLKEVGVHAEEDELGIVCLRGPPKKRQKLLSEEVPDADIVIVSYDTAKRDFEYITTVFPYKMIIADESHFMRSHNSARTKCAIALASRASHRILLSGTPSLGDPLHLYGQLSFLGKYIPATDFWTFKKRYVIMNKTKMWDSKTKKSKTRHLVVGFKNLDLLADKVQKIALRRKKEECLDLPDRSIIDIDFEATPEQKKKYNQLVEGFALELDSGMSITVANAGVMIQKLMQILSGFFILPPPDICTGCTYLPNCVDNQFRPYTKNCLVHPKKHPAAIMHTKKNPKLDALEELLDSILAERRNKVIIYAYFREELRLIENLLRSKDIGYTRIDGSNSSKGPALSEEFDSDPDKRVWLAQISTGIALTLTAATYMVYYSLTYDLGSYLQSMDRNYRIGQKNAVTVYRLICPNSVIKFIAWALSQKKDIASTLVDEINCVLCLNNMRCLGEGIRVFDKGCMHKSKMERVVTHPMRLK